MQIASRFDQAKAFLDAQLGSRERQTLGVVPRHEGPFVTISREAGSGTSQLADLLVRRLDEKKAAGPGWAVFDQNLVEKVLADEHLSPRLAKYMPEAQVSELDASVRELIGLHPNLWVLIRRTVDFMRELAAQGNVILIGRGANFATARVRKGVHVRLVAPTAHREAHMAAICGLTLTEARRHIRKLDSCRRDFVRSVFSTDIANPSAYDLTINVARVGLDGAADLIATMVSKRGVGEPN